MLVRTEIERLKKRIVDYRAQVFGTSIWRSAPTEGDVSRFLATQEPDGSWPDIDYADTTYIVNCSPWEHLMRVEALAAAFHRPQSRYFGAAAILNAAVRGFDAWFVRRLAHKQDSWRINIGRNLSLKNIVMLLEDSLTDEQKNAAVDQLHSLITEADGVYSFHYPRVGIPATGQNLYWLAEIRLYAALLRNSSTEVADAVKVLGSVVEITTGEGINPDYSFLQHGPQLYNGATGYGGIFAEDAARNLAFLHGSPWEAGENEVEILRHYFLDGLQWMIRHRAWDPMTAGRQIAKKRHTEVSADFIRALENMKIGDPGYASSYQAMIDHIEGRNDSALIGNKHFYRADYTAHRRSAYSFHTRMSSERTSITETGNGENTQNFYLAQGTYILLLDGDEYSEIFPCWRWDRIPGGTAPARDPAPTTRQWAVPGTQTFVGGVSNGHFGVSAKDLDWDNVSAKKSWFYFDNEIVCLGAGIRQAGDPIPVFTTINQTIRKSDVIVEYGTGLGEVAPVCHHAVLRHPKWIHHGNVGYLMNEPFDVDLQNEIGVTGDWNSFVPGFYSKGETETRDLVCFAISQGAQPDGATYAYTILPGQSRERVQRYSANPSARIVVNTPELQAVRNERCAVTGIVFWQAASLEFAAGCTLSATSPCLVLVDQAGGRCKICVSSPTAAVVDISFTFGSDWQTIRFALDAGVTVSHES